MPSTESVGGDADEDDGVDPRVAQGRVELAVLEAADSLVGDHGVALLRGQLVGDRRPVAAVLQALGLRDDAEQGRVGVQVGKPGCHATRV